jgi:hypothetical protein
LSATVIGRVVLFTLLCAVVLGVMLVTVSPIVNPPKWDEFIVVYDAHRMVTGQVPYRDFFNFITPGIFLFLAAVESLAGQPSITLGRYAGLVVLLITAVSAWVLLRRSGWSACRAAILSAIYPVALYPFWAVPSHQWLANACLVGTLAVLSGYPALGTAGWALAGVLVGLAGLSLQTQGVVALTFAGVLLAMAPARKARAAAAFFGGLAAVCTLFLAFMAKVGGLQGLWNDTVLWTARNYSRAGNENASAPLQDLAWRLGDLWDLWVRGPTAARALTALVGWLLYALLLAAGAGVLVIAAVALVQTLRHRRVSDPWEAGALAATFLSAGMFFRGSVNWLHFIFMVGPLLLLWLARVGRGGAGEGRWGRRIAATAVVLILAGSGYAHRGLLFYAPAGWELRDADRPIRESPANRFLRSPGVLNPGDTLAAFPEGGEVYLYSAPAAVGYTLFHPLSKGYNDIQDHEAVAEQLRKNRPRYILVPLEMERDYLDPASPVAGVIAQNYHRLSTPEFAAVYEIGSVTGSAAVP